MPIDLPMKILSRYSSRAGAYHPSRSGLLAMRNAAIPYKVYGDAEASLSSPASHAAIACQNVVTRPHWSCKSDPFGHSEAAAHTSGCSLVSIILEGQGSHATHCTAGARGNVAFVAPHASSTSLDGQDSSYSSKASQGEDNGARLQLVVRPCCTLSPESPTANSLRKGRNRRFSSTSQDVSLLCGQCARIHHARPSGET